LERDLPPFYIPIDQIFNAIKDQSWVRHPTRPLPPNQRGPGSGDYCAFHDGRGHLTMDCQTLRRYLRDLVNEGYLWEFVLNPKFSAEVRVQRQLEALIEHLGSTLVQYQEVNTIFSNSPIEAPPPRKGPSMSTKPAGTVIQPL